MTPERFRRLRRALARRQPDLTVLMDGVHKPHNFSAVLRNCDAVGILRANLIPAAEFRPATGVSAGVARYVDVRCHDDLDTATASLRGEGFRLLAAHPAEDAVDFREVDYTRPTALLLGTELHGLTAEAVAAADTSVRIPMQGLVRSLNVSVAAAVILYEAARQRTTAGLYERCRLDDDTFRRTLFEWAYPRVARHCREQDVGYPELDEDGEILGYGDQIRRSDTAIRYGE